MRRKIKLYVALFSAAAALRSPQFLGEYCVLLVSSFAFITFLLPINSALFLEATYGALKFIRQYKMSTHRVFSEPQYAKRAICTTGKKSQAPLNQELARFRTRIRS